MLMRETTCLLCAVVWIAGGVGCRSSSRSRPPAPATPTNPVSLAVPIGGRLDYWTANERPFPVVLRVTANVASSGNRVGAQIEGADYDGILLGDLNAQEVLELENSVRAAIAAIDRGEPYEQQHERYAVSTSAHYQTGPRGVRITTESPGSWELSFSGNNATALADTLASAGEVIAWMTPRAVLTLDASRDQSVGTRPQARIKIETRFGDKPGVVLEASIVGDKLDLSPSIRPSEHWFGLFFRHMEEATNNLAEVIKSGRSGRYKALSITIHSDMFGSDVITFRTMVIVGESQVEISESEDGIYSFRSAETISLDAADRLLVHMRDAHASGEWLKRWSIAFGVTEP